MGRCGCPYLQLFGREIGPVQRVYGVEEQLLQMAFVVGAEWSQKHGLYTVVTSPQRKSMVG